MKPQIKDAIVGVAVGTLLTGGFAWLIQGAHPLVYLGFWVIACAGSMQGAIKARGDNRAAYGEEKK